MRILKNKAFSKWAAREGISDSALRAAVDQMERGLVDADAVESGALIEVEDDG